MSADADTTDARRPCPCCGHLVHDADGWPGSYTICPICFWEDDLVQLRWPFLPGGANSTSLAEAQRNFRAYGACDERSRGSVRPAGATEPVDPAWRPIDPLADEFEDFDAQPRRPWPDDRSVLCWWLPSHRGRPPETEPVPEP